MSEKSKVIRIFPNEDLANISVEFEILDSAVLVQTRGTEDNHVMLLEYYFGDECEGQWEPFIWCCGQLKLESVANQMIVPPIPGKYRFVIMQLDDDGEFLPYDAMAFEDLEIQYRKFDVVKNLADFYYPCCGDRGGTGTVEIGDISCPECPEIPPCPECPECPDCNCPSCPDVDCGDCDCQDCENCEDCPDCQDCESVENVPFG